MLAQRLNLVDSVKNIEDLVPVRFQENALKNTITQGVNDTNYVNTLSKKIQTITARIQKTNKSD